MCVNTNPESTVVDPTWRDAEAAKEVRNGVGRQAGSATAGSRVYVDCHGYRLSNAAQNTTDRCTPIIWVFEAGGSKRHRDKQLNQPELAFHLGCRCDGGRIGGRIYCFVFTLPFKYLAPFYVPPGRP